MMELSDCIAVIPAAGHSRRMGRPKLLLPWQGRTVIAHLVSELRAAGVRDIFVVLRANDEALLAEVVTAGALPVQPAIDPPDMRSSVEAGLAAAAQQTGQSVAAAQDRRNWLLIPADHPIVSRTTVAALLAAWSPSRRRILIPTYEGQRGHPTLFSGDFATEVKTIPPDYGLNWLVRQNAAAIQEVPVRDPGILVDLDTPEDYRALLANSPIQQ